MPLRLQLGDLPGAEALLEQSLSALQGGKSGSGGAAVAWCLESLVSLRLRLGKLQAAILAFRQLQAAQGSGALSASAAAVSVRPGPCILGGLSSGASVLKC